MNCVVTARSLTWMTAASQNRDDHRPRLAEGVKLYSRSALGTIMPSPDPTNRSVAVVRDLADKRDAIGGACRRFRAPD
jgi:hypothetical protein